jgi:hypothetical protein
VIESLARLFVERLGIHCEANYDHESELCNQVHFAVIADRCPVHLRDGPVEEQQVRLYGGKTRTIVQRVQYLRLGF